MSGPIVWVSDALDRQWREERPAPRPGFVWVADLTIREMALEDQPRYTVPYTLIPAAPAGSGHPTEQPRD